VTPNTTWTPYHTDTTWRSSTPARECYFVCG